MSNRVSNELVTLVLHSRGALVDAVDGGRPLDYRQFITLKEASRRFPYTMQWREEMSKPLMTMAELELEDEIGNAIDMLHVDADEQDKIRQIPAFRMVCLDD